LTTVRLPLTELGEQAIVLTLGDRVRPGEDVSVRGEVIRRESTRLPHRRP
jgi:DNA-binding LacI/PurR family transcriptional regulator